jgi:hypothetical protein
MQFDVKSSSAPLRMLTVALLLAAAPTVALAYIDPGNGAFMVQALFTMVGAALFYVRHPIRFLQTVWRKVTGRWSGLDAPPTSGSGVDPKNPVP